MTRVTQMGGVEAQGQPQSQQNALDPTQPLARKESAPRSAQQGDEAPTRKPTTFTDWAAI